MRRTLVGRILRIFAALSAAAVVGHFAPHWGRLPYNVRELFALNGAVTGAVIGVTVLSVGSLVWWLARVGASSPKIYGALQIPLLAAVASLVYLALASCIPAESLDDIVGTPVLGGSPLFERGWRFVGLVLAPLAGLTSGLLLGQLPSASRPLSSVFACLITLAIACGVSYGVAITHACTDNITELLQNDGHSIKVAGLIGWCVVIGTASSCLTNLKLPASKKGVSQAVVLFLAIVVSAPFGWLLVSVALEPDVEKYGKTFSAMQFLLSADRTRYADVWVIFVRFAMVHYVAVGLLSYSDLFPAIASRRILATVPIEQV